MAAPTSRQRGYALHLIKRAGFFDDVEALRAIAKTGRSCPPFSDARRVAEIVDEGNPTLDSLNPWQAGRFIACLKMWPEAERKIQL